MKLHNTFLIGIMSIACLTSCLSEDFDNGLAAAGTGALEVSVDLMKPATRATQEVTNFPVIISDAAGAVLYNYNTVAEVPQSIILQVGNYNVLSHTPGEITKSMDAPYYKGSADVEILKDVKSPVNVICKMENSVINVNFSDDFKSTFSAWDITVNDGSETALSFLSTTGTVSAYWWFGENGAKELTVNFRGTTKDGNTVASKYVLTKANAVEGYDTGRENFCGGDIININFDPTDATDGTVTSMTINADVTFVETNQTVIVQVVDVPTLNPTDPEPGPGESNIKLTLPRPITMSAAESATYDPSTGDVNIETANGVKSIVVNVKSSSDEMMDQLTAVADEYPGVDLVHGCEVVGNNNLAAFLGSLGKTIDIPSTGDKSYTFPVGQFYLFLGLLPGKHDFILTVTDLSGDKNSGTVTVTITE